MTINAMRIETMIAEQNMTITTDLTCATLLMMEPATLD